MASSLLLCLLKSLNKLNAVVDGCSAWTRLPQPPPPTSADLSCSSRCRIRLTIPRREKTSDECEAVDFHFPRVFHGRVLLTASFPAVMPAVRIASCVSGETCKLLGKRRAPGYTMSHGDAMPPYPCLITSLLLLIIVFISLHLDWANLRRTGSQWCLFFTASEHSSPGTSAAHAMPQRSAGLSNGFAFDAEPRRPRPNESFESAPNVARAGMAPFRLLESFCGEADSTLEAF